MTNLQLTEIPSAKSEMLIRKPVAEVFEAFVNPEITARFWFTKSTGRVEAGKSLTWTWEMYDISVQVNVKEVEAGKRILIEWGNYGSMTTVEWVSLLIKTTRPTSALQIPVSTEMEIRLSEMRSIPREALRGFWQV